MSQPLKLSSNKMLSGVCGGIAEYFNIDYAIVRIIAAVAAICTGIVGGLIIYLIMYIIMKNN